MATANGSDTQINFLSISSGIAQVGSGGTSPQPLTLPATLPVPFVVDPAKPLIVLNAANSTGVFDAILKVGDDTCNLIWLTLSVAQGWEDALNLNNHASNNTFGGDLSTAGAPGKRVVTVKGGSSNVTLGTAANPLILHQHGSGGDIELGMWSDESYDYSTSIDLTHVQMADGSKVLVTEGHVKSVTYGPNCQKQILRSWGFKAYWWLKWLCRKCLGVQLGKPGPSFLP